VKISLGNYIPRDSFVHHLDPRVKLLLMALGIGVCFHIDTLLGLGLFLGMCLCMTKLAAIPLKRLFSGLAPFLWLFVFTALLHVFMTPGKPLPLLPQETLLFAVAIPDPFGDVREPGLAPAGLEMPDEVFVAELVHSAEDFPLDPDE
jgi:energy-coupling factor transporter transmembrane protein EcfT